MFVVSLRFNLSAIIDNVANLFKNVHKTSSFSSTRKIYETKCIHFIHINIKNSIFYL